MEWVLGSSGIFSSSSLFSVKLLFLFFEGGCGLVSKALSIETTSSVFTPQKEVFVD